MFIICPKCSAKYQIPEGTVLQEGQKLKCSACDFVFLKGEEAPLVLEKPVVQEPVISATEAFSSPLYTQPISENQALPVQAQSLPEAFQPVVNPSKSRSYLLFIPIYIILIIALCMMGWHFRDLLKPSVEELVPQAVFEKKESEKGRIVQNKPTIEKEIKNEKIQPSVKENKNIVSNIPPKKTVTKEVEKIKNVPLVQSNPTSSVVKPALQQKINISEAAEKEKLPEVVKPELPEVVKETVEIQAEEDIVPLFEAISAPVPMATKSELEVTKISFKVTPNDQGIEQLLVEGILQNKSSEIRSVPALTVVLLDKDNMVLNRKKIHVDNEYLTPEQTLPFYTGITPVPMGIDHVDVQF